MVHEASLPPMDACNGHNSRLLRRQYLQTPSTPPHQRYFDLNPLLHCYSTPNPQPNPFYVPLSCAYPARGEPMYPTSPQPNPTGMCVGVCVQCCRSTIHGIQKQAAASPQRNRKKCIMLCSHPPPGTTLDRLARKQELFRTCTASGCLARENTTAVENRLVANTHAGCTIRNRHVVVALNNHSIK